jgi:ATP-dependent DNA helicase RecQ
VIAEHDRAGAAAASAPPRTDSGPAATAFELYRQGRPVEEVMRRLQLPRSGAVEHLADFIRRERPGSITPWVAPETQQRIAAAARVLNTDRPEPLFRFLEGQVSYDEIRLVLAQHR